MGYINLMPNTSLWDLISFTQAEIDTVNDNLSNLLTNYNINEKGLFYYDKDTKKFIQVVEWNQINVNRGYWVKYKDTEIVPPVVDEPTKIVNHKLIISGLDKITVENNKSAFENDIAKSLGVNSQDVA